MWRSIRRISRILIPNRGTRLSPEERLNKLRERVNSVSHLRIKEAERRLGVKRYADRSEHAGYLSPLIYKKVKPRKSKLAY